MKRFVPLALVIALAAGCAAVPAQHTAVLETFGKVHDKTWGPGLLCRAMGIDKTLNGADLRGDVLWLEKPTDRTRPQPRIARSARIGVDYAGEWARRPWRFYDKDSAYVSTASARLRAVIAQD